MKRDNKEVLTKKNLKVLEGLAEKGVIMQHFRGEIKCLSKNGPKIKVYIATIVKPTPIKKNDEFLYKIANYCMLNDKKKCGGAIDVELISPKKLKKKELLSIVEGVYHPILGIISQSYSIMEDAMEERMELFDTLSSNGFFGFGEPKISWNGKNLTKEEFFQEQLKECLILNKIIPSEFNFNGVEIKKVYYFKNFKLDFVGKPK